MTTTPTLKNSFTYKLLLWLVLISTLLGQLFKVLHYPGAALLLIISTLSFTLFYLPLYVLEVWKEQTSAKAKVALVLQNFILFLFSLGFLFKGLHLPGAGVLFYFNHFILLLVVAPFAIYHIVKALGKSNQQPYHYLVLVYFFTLCIGALFNSSSGKVNLRTILPQLTQKERLISSTESRNQLLYNEIEKGALGNFENTAIQKLKRLQNNTKACISTLLDTKKHLIAVGEGLSETEADTLKAALLTTRSSADQTNVILIGTPYKPNTGKYSANALKLAIQGYRDSIMQLVESSNKLLVDKSISLVTDNYVDPESGDIISWELINFQDQPLITIVQQLLNLQYEILNAEYQVQADIIRSAQTLETYKAFTQLEKLEHEKALLKLRQDNEHGMQLLTSKNVEIDDMGSTIFGFVLLSLLCIALLFFVVRNNLERKKINTQLQQQKEVIALQKNEVESQKHLVEEKQKEILDSIAYAKRLQSATLPAEEFISKHLPNTFILYLPKDIVAGDFYWADFKHNTMYIAAADSTGHGVPGAMVSMVCANALNRAINEFNCVETGTILDKTRELVIEAFAKNNNDVKDGMDISLLAINHSEQKVSWSGANNPLWYLQEGALKEIKADKQPIGKTDHAKNFTTHAIPYVKESIFYLFTDGFADQFGGPQGKKFKYKQLEQLLQSTKNRTMQQQKEELHTVFSTWKGHLEQVDDICIIGLRL